MRSKWLGLFGIMLALMLLVGPLAGGALAAGDHGGHDMSTMNQSDQMGGHDMNNMDGMEMGGMSQDSSGGHDSASGGDHGGHGGVDQDPNTPPNWPVIYGFGGFNLLVILAAAVLKNKGVNGVN